MIFQSLASSSHGNAYIISDSETRILLECGLSYRKLQKASGFTLDGLAACFISHEHKDHAGCWRELLKNGLKVYASGGTADALESEEITVMEERRPVAVGTLEVMSFRVFHDAAEPVGFLVRSRVDGDKLAFATDTVNLQYQFPGVTILAVECNYETSIIERRDRIPEKVRQRIRNNHMEVSRLCRWLAGLDLSACREIHLLHLSDACSNEADFVRMVQQCVPAGIGVSACPRENTALEVKARKEQWP